MDRLTMRELLQVRDIISINYGISSGEASRAVGVLNVGGRFDDLRAVLAGDLSCVPPVLGDLGIKAAAGLSTAAGAAASSKAASNIKNDNKRAAAPVGAPGGAVAAAGSSSDKMPTVNNKARKTSSKARNKGGAAGINTASGITAAAGVLSPSVGDDLVKGSADDLQAVEGDILKDTPAGVLPDNVAALVRDCIEGFCQDNKIDDLSRERQPRWSAACMAVGACIFKSSKILHDIPRERVQGGIVYDVGRVSALVELWVYLCSIFCKAPLVVDFAYFSGISEAWFYGVGSPGGLTPARAALAKKLKQVQEGGLSSMIVDGRQNPTGALAALNHWHGWTQTREVIHTSGAASAAAPALPVFGSDGLLIEDKTE